MNAISFSITIQTLREQGGGVKAIVAVYTGNSPDLNILDYHIWRVVFKAYRKHHTRPKLKTIVELKETRQVIWNSLPRRLIDNAVEEIKSD